jgi:DNA-binding NarL/FixJ family response regulator
MTNDQSRSVSDRPIKILTIDDDPIFRLGIYTALNAFSDFQIVAQADSVATALSQLTEAIPDVVVLEPAIEKGWQLCEQIKQAHPDLPIFLLSTTSDTERLLAAKTAGVEGYAPKGTAIGELVEALRQVVAGETQWQAIIALPLAHSRQQPIRKKSWFVSLRQSGLEQIEESLAQVNSQLDNPQLSLFDWLFWSGRRRELLAARWLVERLLPVEVIVIPEASVGERDSRMLRVNNKASLLRPSFPVLAPSWLVSQTSPASVVLNNTLAKIQLGIENLTNIPLEIDILQPSQKQELFYLVLNQFKKVLEALRSLHVTREELPQKRTLVLRDLFESSLLDCFSRYYTPLDLTNEKIIDILSLDTAIAQEEILEKIPMVVELLSYFLFENTLSIDNISYQSESPEAITRAEILLQNLINRIANAVMQVILNNFSEVEVIKQNLYNKKYISSRDIAQFRNNISWKYRREKYLEEPKNIFESKYQLFFLNGGSLKTIYIYAPRQDELARLRGTPWLVTIAFELRDALAPRLRAIVGFLGNGAVYLLTHVIGKAIGLIGRGILQGIGNTLQETRYRKNSEREK